MCGKWPQGRAEIDAGDAVITICKYDDYQNAPRVGDAELTQQPTRPKAIEKTGRDEKTGFGIEKAGPRHSEPYKAAASRLEGPLRHAIRSDLCLQGWKWKDANRMARELLEMAFMLVRAVRPSWNEGQREWTIEAGTLIERTRCTRCHNRLPEGHHKFCSRLCNTIYSGRLSDKRHATEEQAIRMAICLD